MNGDVGLDYRLDEAFKPVMLSSMHVSAGYWDAQSAFAGNQTYQIPESGWMITPAVSSSFFGLYGGSSLWKTNAPNVEIDLEQPLKITGWVTGSSNPNDDNVGFWAASDQVLRSWSYAIKTTLGAVTPPTVMTNPASGITTTEATLNGTVNAKNGSTTVTFQYGTTVAYGSTGAADQSPVTGNTNIPVTKAITGLIPHTIYHYRIVATNNLGTTYGADMTFKTSNKAMPWLMLLLGD